MHSSSVNGATPLKAEVSLDLGSSHSDDVPAQVLWKLHGTNRVIIASFEDIEALKRKLFSSTQNK